MCMCHSERTLQKNGPAVHVSLGEDTSKEWPCEHRSKAGLACTNASKVVFALCECITPQLKQQGPYTCEAPCKLFQRKHRPVGRGPEPSCRAHCKPPSSANGFRTLANNFRLSCPRLFVQLSCTDCTSLWRLRS